MRHSMPLLVAVLAGCAISAYAQEAPAPALREGDKWVYSVKIEKPPNGASTRHWENVVQRVGSSGMVLANKPVDSNMPPNETAYQNDWSRMVSINGKMTTTNKYFDFPLKTGKTWQVAVTQEKPNPRLKLLRTTQNYKVIGWEDVTVPAGTFKALKIEADGDWYNEFEPTNASASATVQTGATGNTALATTRPSMTPTAVTGKSYRAFWYLPDAKREIKSVIETFNSSGGLSERTTSELESFAMTP